ncbi:hypothetical protein [Undibacterium sp.]|uniref:hypothetical protein n=1 Tax=Undibacterium sp. TaxID=1914977 RepID=UPI002731F835|nr:hypothetical protein [Undibacterium sp.]MDP1980363.1 hypothetical protein [Undibacterium sp.]
MSMEDLQSVCKYLEEKGLQTGLSSAESMYVKKTGDASLEIRVISNRFNLRRWDYVPGPGEDDFCFDIDSLDEITLIVWNYFFAQPIKIADWDIALHRYPYWSLQEMQYRLANLVHVTQDQFQAIHEERYKRYERTSIEYLTRLDIAETTQFMCCGKHMITGEKLMIRRDMQEAYAVRLE